MTPTLIMWTVYNHPKDYPNHFVARKWLIGSKRNEAEATDEVIAKLTLDEVRRSLPPYLYCIGRQAGDDPCIIETWL